MLRLPHPPSTALPVAWGPVSLGLVVLLAAAPVAADDPPEPLSAWASPDAVPHYAPRGLPEPLNTRLPIEDPFAPWGAGVPAARDAFAEALVQGLEAPRGALTRPAWPGPSRVGVRSQARDWLTRLPVSLVEGVATRLGPAPRANPASVAQCLRAWSESRRPLDRAQRGRALGETLFEHGDFAGALLVWRAAIAEGAEDLERRVRLLRGMLPSRYEGSRRGAAPAAPSQRQVLWARRAPGGDRHLPRALTSDGTRIYYTDSQGVVAARVSDGLLAWRTGIQGDSAADLVAGSETILLRQPTRLVGLRAVDGEPQWTVEAPPSSESELRFVRAAPNPRGFVVLVAKEGRRLLRAYNEVGGLIYEVRLWAAPAFSGSVRWYAPLVVPPGKGPADGDAPPRAHPEAFSVLPTPGPLRRVVGDGRLAVLGDRVFVCWDGVLAACDLTSGELLWQQERYLGREVNGERVLVGLGVGPFEVNAVTATGMLVRLDPLSGRSLPLPPLPDGVNPGSSTGDFGTPPRNRPYVMSLAPLCLLYDLELGFEVRVGPEGELLTRLALGPLGPGCVRGPELLVPDGEGLVSFDLGSGRELGLVGWPGETGATRVVGGLTLFSGPTLVALFGERPTESAPAPTGPLAEDLEGLVAQLASSDWRLRLRAQQALGEWGESSRELLEEVIQLGSTADVRDQARLALRRLELETVFRELIPSGEDAILRQLLSGVGTRRQLQRMLQHVRPRQGGSRRLLRLTLAIQDPQLQHGYLELLVLVDGRLRERLLERLRDPKQPVAVRQGCAQLLAVYAERSQDDALLRRACEGDAKSRALALAAQSARNAAVGASGQTPLERTLLELLNAEPGVPELAVSAERAERALLGILGPVLEGK